MVIALLLSSLLCGLAGATAATVSGFGLLMIFMFYMAGGMIGTVGCVLLSVTRCTPATETRRARIAPQPSS